MVVRSDGRDCVVLAFMRTWSTWYCSMATDAGGYFLTAADVILGQVVKWSESMVIHHVGRVGE
jgi:hypothetical protein